LAAGVLQIDYLVMSQYLEPRDVVVYNLSSKIFLLIFFVYSSLLSALWPVCAEASAANNWTVLLRHVRKTIVLGVVLVLVGTAVFALFKVQIISALSPKEVVTVPLDLILLFGLYYLLRVWSDVFGVVLQSMSYMRPFVIYIPFQVALNVLIQVVITKEIGVRGVLIGLITSYLLTAAWIAPWFVFRRKRQHIGAVI
jgi:O-antigen/teichoic acid export membrane protein